jgi:predicted XRE-type DNA-binding protein
MMTDLQPAIQEARRRRALRRQHFAVVQRDATWSVMPIGNPDAFRAAWTTKDDCREVAFDNRTRTKLDADDIPLILDLRASGMKLREIATKFDVSISAIGHVCSGYRWQLSIAE